MKLLSFCFLTIIIIILAFSLLSSSVDAKSQKSQLLHSLTSSSTDTLVINVTCNSSVGGELQAARDKIRSMQPLTQNVRVQVTGTCVSPSHASPILELFGDKDSAPAGYKITYAGDAMLTGGKQIPNSSWRKSTLNPDALMVDLAEIGISAADIGDFAAGSLGQCTSNRAELFLSGVPMTLARSPNTNTENGPFMQWMQISDFDASKGKDSFSSMNPDLQKLAGKTWSPKNSVWFHGYWSFDWADSWVKVDSVQSTSSSDYNITVDSSTPPVYGFKKTARFYVVNHPSLLDADREYYIDDSHFLHFIPPSTMKNTTSLDAWISINNNDLVYQNGATLSGVSFEGLSVIYGRQSGVSFTKAANINVNSVTISSFAKNGADFSGSNIQLQNVQASHFGCSGIGINGGDEKTLTPSGNSVVSSTISLMGRITRCYTPGIHYSGVGHVFKNNFIHTGPHAGILGGGNNHLIQNNTLHFLVFGSRDSGAFYSGRSWVHRGTLLENNHFMHVRTIEPTFLGSTLIVAIYFDDELSGMHAKGNTIVDADGGFLLGGGRDNIIEENSCTNIDQYCVHFDNRGMNWQRAYCTPPNGQLVEGLYAVNYTQPPYSTQYPLIVNTLIDRPCVPVGNIIQNNTYQNDHMGFCDESTATINSWGSTIANNRELNP